MNIRIHFERSESCAEEHNQDPDERAVLNYDTEDGPWVQLTYGSLRRQDGAMIASIDDCGRWSLNGVDKFSDVIIEVVGT